jgi:hypothetical protein
LQLCSDQQPYIQQSSCLALLSPAGLGCGTHSHAVPAATPACRSPLNSSSSGSTAVGSEQVVNSSSKENILLLLPHSDTIPGQMLSKSSAAYTQPTAQQLLQLQYQQQLMLIIMLPIKP